MGALKKLVIIDIQYRNFYLRSLEGSNSGPISVAS